ncbi:MAG: RNA polymerase factor sigma-54 [Aquificae bacterium]|nr:RNA polymerase factor sigma-54 [Aquificota bacterium]
MKHTLTVTIKQKPILSLVYRIHLTLLVKPKLEFQNTIKQELEENPFLEEVLTIDPKIEYEPVVKDLTSRYYDEEDEEKIRSNRLVYKPTLMDILETQIDLEFEGIEREIAYEIVGNLDEKGLFKLPLEEIAKKLNVSVEKVEEVRKRLRYLEPTGIASRSIEEALLVQYEDKYGKDELAKKIIKEDLPHIATKGKEYLYEKYKDVDKEKIDKILFHIKTLNPYPTINFSSEIQQYVEPDVYIYDKGDSFEIVVNETGIPEIKLINPYKRLFSNKNLSPQAKEFLMEKLNKAKGIIEAIHQRKENLLKITKAIVKKQEEFLRKGKEFLKPLTLKDIAQEVGLHESTISRTVNSKYALTPQGLLPLKAFFSTKLQTSSGDVSTEKVKYMIQELIENEDKKKPLSDQAIVNILKEKGIKIARRTVTKYREELGIPDSRTRRIKV